MTIGVLGGASGGIFLDHQESLPVKRDVERSSVVRILEQPEGGLHTQRGGGRIDAHRREPVRSVEVEELAAASRPCCEIASAGRHLPASGLHFGEGSDKDLGSPTLVGGVGHEATVRRERWEIPAREW